VVKFFIQQLNDKDKKSDKIEYKNRSSILVNFQSLKRILLSKQVETLPKRESLAK